MGLHVENEIIHLALCGGLGVHHFRCFYFEKVAEDFVHGRERRGHAAGRAQELTPVDPQLLGVASRHFEQMVLDGFLLLCLWERVVLLVRHHLGRYRQMAVQVSVQVALLDPAVVRHGPRRQCR